MNSTETMPYRGAAIAARRVPLSPVKAPAPVKTVRDSWSGLSRYTSARIALGRAGGSLRTASLLDFRLSHARARDAVYSPFDAESLCADLNGAHLPTYVLNTAVQDRRQYLMRPDLGRRLDDASRERLKESAKGWGRRDLAILISDGLAAQASMRHAVATVVPLCERLLVFGWTLYPIFVVHQGRVKLQDEIGELLGARQTLMLLGERPGLGSPDSLGAYFTYKPRAACTDADRNCVSNIRPEGLSPSDAADKLIALLGNSVRLGLSGVALKDGDARILA
jgi:ethanolamine ammonia-lyase small subunit